MKTIFLFALCLGLTVATVAQETYTSSGKPLRNQKKVKKTQGFDRDRLIFGGGLGLGFSNVSTNLGVSPILGYSITDRWSGGIGLGYQYFSIRDYWMVENPGVLGTYSYKPLRTNLFSGSVWTRYIVYDNIFAHAELEYNHMRFKSYQTDYLSNQIVSKTNSLSAPSLLLGAGIRQPLADRASLIIMALYDVLNRPNDPDNPDRLNPYGNRIFFRGGFTIGF